MLGNLISLAITGIIIGWATGLLVRGRGFGLIHDLVLGVLGAVVGGLIFQVLGIQGFGMLATIATGVCGAVVLLAIVGWLFRDGSFRGGIR